MEKVLNINFSKKAKGFVDLTKVRLSMTVVLSSGFGYALASPSFSLAKFLWLIVGAYFVTASANVINQLYEVNYDKLMNRTRNRPLPLRVISAREAALFAFFLGLSGLAALALVFNFKVMLLSFLSLLLYGFVYTPLKRVGPIAVAVGALPGAFPPMIGWVAATNSFGLEPGILFAIQFFWQFPHFWAIAWVLDEDYTKAGFRLLPSKGGRDMKSAFQIMIYTLFLLPLCWIPYYLGMTGVNSAVVAMLCGILFLSQTLRLMQEMSAEAARKLMFGSFLYLPVVQVAYLIDKI